MWGRGGISEGRLEVEAEFLGDEGERRGRREKRYIPHSFAVEMHVLFFNLA